MSSTHVVIPVSGMTCAACQARVQRAIERVPGVHDAVVNLLMENATVDFDPAATSPDVMVDAIRATGYGAELPSPEVNAIEQQEALDAAQAEEFRALRNRAVISGGAAVVAMVLSMPLMMAHQHTTGVAAIDPLMRWVNTALSPALERWAPWLFALPPAVISWSLFAMTLAIMAWAGRQFYVKAWNGLAHGGMDMNTLIAVGTGAAFLYSTVATVLPSLFTSAGLMPDVYYEAVVIIIALILTG